MLFLSSYRKPKHGAINLKINQYIESTHLKPDLTQNEIKEICKEAKLNDFVAVCTHPFYVKMVKESLKQTKVKVCSVVSYPLGTSTTQVKVAEAIDALIDGADEIDLVFNGAAFKNEDFDYVLQDIQEVVNAVRNKQMIVKVIVQMALFNQEEIKKITELIIASGAHFIKCIFKENLTNSDEILGTISNLRDVIGNKLKISCFGEFSDEMIVKKMLESRCQRIGTTTPMKLLKLLK